MKPEEIKELLEQHRAILANLEPIEDQLGDAVTTAAERYIAITKRHHKYTHLPHKLAGYWDWNIIGNEVKITWEESWSYGGHDEGSFTFDVAFVFDEEMFTKLEATLAARKEAATRSVEEKKRAARHQQYEKLKAEFGE